MWEKINKILKGQVVTSSHCFYSTWSLPCVYAGEYDQCDL